TRKRGKLIAGGTRRRLTAPIRPKLRLLFPLRQWQRRQFLQERSQVLRRVELAAAAAGEFGEKLVIRGLARHLSIILVNDETGPRRRKIIEQLTVDIFPGAGGDDDIFTGGLGFPEGAAFIPLLARGGHLVLD